MTSNAGSIASPGTKIPSPPASAKEWRDRAADLAGRASEARAVVAEALGPSTTVPEIDVSRPWSIPGTVDRLFEQCVQAMRDTEDAGTTSAAGLSGVVHELHRLSSDLEDHRRALVRRRFKDCDEGLTRLRTIQSSRELVDQTCEVLVQRCGFARAMLSRVKAETWRPWTLFLQADAPGAPWFHEWVDRRIPFAPETGEAEAFRARLPQFGHEPESAGREATSDGYDKSSFVVAPVVQGRAVIGLLHADHFPSERPVDEADRQILWRLAEGFAQVYERVVLTERLEEQRSRVQDALANTQRMVDEFVGTDLPFGAPHTASASASETVAEPPTSGPPAAAFRTLTKRERQVYELMVTGAANDAIAEHLVIAPGTVKFHVQNILRKLGAVNRAHAVACVRLPPDRSA